MTTVIANGKVSNELTSRLSNTDDAWSVGNSDIGDVEIDDLDADEFELPPVETPGLQQILNESDEFLLPDEFLPTIDGADFTSPQKSSTSSLSGSLAGKKRQVITTQNVGLPAIKEPEVLRCSKLRGLTAQVNSAKDKVQAGSPSALAVHAKLVAVGTTHSVVLVFDRESEVLKSCLGEARKATELGQVSALAINADATRLLIGYSRGAIAFYDVTGQGRCLYLSWDCHTIGQCVLHVCFTHHANVAVCCDSGGSVFQLHFGGLVRKAVNSRCVFSGCRGEACTIAPLLPPTTVNRHPSDEASVLAMATLTKLIVVKLRPKVKAIFSLSLEGPATTLPVATWQFVPIQVSDSERLQDPVLCFGRHQMLYFYHMRCVGDHQFRFYCLQKFEVTNYSVLNAAWLNTGCLCVLDTREQLHLLDLGASEELESLDCSDVNIVYSVADFKGLSSGGNVSAALAYAADAACYQAFRTCEGKVYLLGVDAIYVVSIRTWLERVNSFTKRNNFADAIRLCLNFHDGKTRLGLGVGRSPRWREIVADKAVELALEYLDLSMTSLCPEAGQVQVLQEHFKNVVPLVVGSIVRLQKPALLFERVWPRVSQDVYAKSAFLDCLEENVTGGKLRNLPPELLQELCAHLEHEGLLPAFEQCVLHMDVDKLDIHQVMKICRTHRLYDPVIYIFNQALDDFISPLEDMLYELSQAVSTTPGAPLRDEDIELGNKVLIYLSCCLCGRAYPSGQLSTEKARQVSTKVYKFITALRSGGTDQSSPDDPMYPYLRILLKFDAHEFLNVLAMAFETDMFTDEEGHSRCQRFLDIMVQLLMAGVDFTVVDQSALFTFTSRQLIRNAALSLTRSHLHQLIESVVSVKDSVWSSSFLERQQALLELLQTPRTALLLDRQQVLRMAEKSHFWQVCELIVWQQRNFSRAVECYLNDVTRKEQVFDCFTKALALPDLMQSERLELRSKLLQSIKDLVQLNSLSTARLINDHFGDAALTAVQKLAPNEALQCTLLSQMLDYRLSTNASNFCADDRADEELGLLYVKLLALNEDSQQDVVHFLSAHPQYCTDQALVACREAHAKAAIVYLLELKGELHEAFEFLLKDLRAFRTGCAVDADSLTCIQQAISFCKRNYDRFSSSEKETNWFSLFDAVLPLRTILPTALQDVIEAMLVYVDGAQLMDRLFKHDVFSSGHFKDLEPMLRSIFVNYSYQEVLYGSVARLLRLDELDALHQSQRRTCGSLKHGGVGSEGSSSFCSLCGSSYDDSGHNHLLLFSCGCMFHGRCMDKGKHFERGKRGEKLWMCPRHDAQTDATAPFAEQKPATRGHRATVTWKDRSSSISWNVLQEMKDQNNPFVAVAPGGAQVFRPLRLAPPKK